MELIIIIIFIGTFRIFGFYSWVPIRNLDLMSIYYTSSFLSFNYAFTKTMIFAIFKFTYKNHIIFKTLR